MNKSGRTRKPLTINLKSNQTIYEQLLNAVSNSAEELAEVYDFINKSIISGSSDIILLRLSIIQKSVNKRKSNKSAGPMHLVTKLS